MQSVRRTWIAISLVWLSLSPVLAAGSNDAWVAQHFGGDARLLCNVHKEGEQFVVASLGDKVKLGYKLDMTTYDISHSFTTGWRLLGENGESVVARIPPQAVRDEYVKVNGKTFAEGIQIQNLTSPRPAKLHAMIYVKKCRSTQCDARPSDTRSTSEYTVDVCVVPLAN